MKRGYRERRRGFGSGGLLGWLSVGVLLVGVAVVFLYVLSRVLTDRFVWSQWVWWVPAGWFVVGVWGLLSAGLVIGLAGMLRGKLPGRGEVKRKKSQVGVRLGLGLLAGCVVMSCHFFFGAWRIQNAVGGYGIHWTSSAGHGRVRVLHWNIASGSFDELRAIERLNRESIDVLLLANTRWDGQRQALVEGFEKNLNNDFYGFGEAGVVRRMSRAVVVSRYPIVSSQTLYVSARDRARDTSADEGGRDEALRATGDFGWVLMLRLDGGEMYGEFDVWMVDLPSEPSVHRTALMGRVAELIEGSDWESANESKPALVIGDFNTVRGSASLEQFDVFENGDGFVDAFEARGAGGGSWRPSGLKGARGWFAERSSWHIDLSLVGNGWGVDGYELFVPEGAVWGEGVSHKAQVVDIVRE